MSKLNTLEREAEEVKMVLVSRHLERIGDLLCKIGARIVFVDEDRRVWIK
jgi:phosphate transport system protein